MDLAQVNFPVFETSQVMLQTAHSTVLRENGCHIAHVEIPVATVMTYPVSLYRFILTVPQTSK